MLKTAITIMIYAGMRPGEVFGLRFQDIDFENMRIKVEQALCFDWEDADIKTKCGLAIVVDPFFMFESRKRNLYWVTWLKFNARLINKNVNWEFL